MKDAIIIGVISTILMFIHGTIQYNLGIEHQKEVYKQAMINKVIAQHDSQNEKPKIRVTENLEKRN